MRVVEELTQCLNSGIHQGGSLAAKYQFEQNLAKAGITVHNGRLLQTNEEGEQRWIGGESKAELRTAFTFGENVAQFFRDYPFEQIAMFTVAFEYVVKTPKEAARRFDSFNSNWLRKQDHVWIRVCEPHKDKRPHYHFLIWVGEDIRTGFDFEAFIASQDEFQKNGRTPRFEQLRKQYIVSAPEALRKLWGDLRREAKAAGIGRTELLPIRKKGEAVGAYVGKYLAKGSPYRVGAWKGARLVSYCQKAPRRASSRFSWVESGREFREWAAEVSEWLDCDHDTISEVCGPRWAWKLLQAKEAGLDASAAAQIALTLHKLQGK